MVKLRKAHRYDVLLHDGDNIIGLQAIKKFVQDLWSAQKYVKQINNF